MSPTSAITDRNRQVNPTLWPESSNIGGLVPAGLLSIRSLTACEGGVGPKGGVTYPFISLAPWVGLLLRLQPMASEDGHLTPGFPASVSASLWSAHLHPDARHLLSATTPICRTLEI